jgi:hypothetical protein
MIPGKMWLKKPDFTVRYHVNAHDCDRSSRQVVRVDVVVDVNVLVIGFYLGAAWPHRVPSVPRSFHNFKTASTPMSFAAFAPSR